MKSNTNKSKSIGWIYAMLLLAFMMPQRANADAVQQESKYTVSLGSANTIIIRVPVKDDKRVLDGELKYTIMDGSNTTGTVIKWASIDGNEWKEKTGGSVPSNYYALDLQLYQSTLYTITPGINYELQYVGAPLYYSASHWIWTQKNSSESEYWCKIEWRVPADIRGKTLKFHWNVKLSGGSVSPNDVTITVPDPPMTLDPNLSQATIMPEEPGKIGYAWYIATPDVKKATAYYKNSPDDEGFTSMTLEPEMNGTVLLDATKPHYEFHIVANYEDSQGYLIENRKSDKETVPMLHQAINFKATPLDDGKGTVMLNWDTDMPGYPDIFENDFFEIQRSPTGKDEDFETFASVMYDSDIQQYELKDSTYFASLKRENLDPMDDLPLLRYRIRRASTSVWGWDGNPTMQEQKIRFNKVRLFIPENTSAEWADEAAHTAKVSWNYIPSDENCWYAWDERASMKLRVRTFNLAGEPVDSTDYDLSYAEVMAKTKTIQLNRSCVNYKMELISNSGSSAVINKVKTVKIKDTWEWIDLCQAVKYEDQLYINVDLLDDILVSTAEGVLGTEERPFIGNVNGNGHSITIDDQVPFTYVKDATFRNLTIKGRMTRNDVAIGLLEHGENVTIENCRMDVSMTWNDYAVGFIGEADGCTITNCLVSGGLNNTKPLPYAQWHGFLRVKEGSRPSIIKNCLFAPNPSEGSYQPHSVVDGKSWNFLRPDKWGEGGSIENCYYIGEPFYVDEGRKIIQGEQLPDDTSQRISLLGENWNVSNDWPGIVPFTKFVESLDTIVVSVDCPTFYYQNSGKVSKTVIAQTHQSSVGLAWETDGNVVDYFQVLRKIEGKPDSTYEIIAPEVTGSSYEDTSVSPLYDYVYKIRSIVDCEGLHYEESDPVKGACKHTGKIVGRVLYPDGTGQAGITISIASEDNSVKTECTTNDEGYFEVDELPYQGKTSITYNVTPVSKNKITLEVTSYPVTFNSSSNYEELKPFIITSGYRFSGFVMYEGTSIPVKGAGFQVNGHNVKTSTGKPLQTDFEGKFSFYVNSGNNIIQAVMDGHTFTEGGYYKSPDGVDFKGDVDQIYFYDNKKVKLIGRIVGGDTQGNLPLDNNISQNNIGTGVKMVLTLEGDNTSWLVYDNLNPELSIRDEVIPHEDNDKNHKYFTKVHTTRKRIEVSPDSLTGEYRLLLPPVRWKVQQLYSDGYPTLFQEGMVSEVIDLTDCLTEHSDTLDIPNDTYTTASGEKLKGKLITSYNAIYNRIYHSPVELIYKQKNYDNFNYLGDRTYKYKSVDGTSLKVPLAEPDSTAVNGVKYTFGHPVFSMYTKYPLQLMAVERYYWNNNQSSDTIDVVQVGGGKVTLQNGMKQTNNRQVVELNEKGEGIAYLEVDQVPWLLTGKDALRTVTMTLELDGTDYEAKPIRGYVFNIFPIAESKDVLSVSQPMLVDILRDPPGGGSTATLAKGSTLKLGYLLDMKYKAGLGLSWVTGSSLANFTGFVAAPMGAGTTYGINFSADTETLLEFEYAINGEGTRAFSYTMNVNQDIQTSSDINMVGADADLYIGTVQNLVVTPASTIRAIPDHIFKQMEGKLPGATLPDGSTQKYGQLVEIASGVADNDTLYHLVRDESLLLGPKVESTFIHSQKYIITQLIPSLVEHCRSLMFTGTAEEAQTLANATSKPVYRSLVPADADNFAVMNIKNGEAYYYSSDMPEEEGMNYVIHLPSGLKDMDFPDEVELYCNNIQSWVNMIAQNEKEKLTAYELVKNFDIDGGGTTSYAENFSSEYSISNYMHLPGIITGDYFDDNVSDKALAVASIFGIPIVNHFLKSLWGKLDSKADASGTESDKNFTCKIHFTGKTFEFRILPSLDYDVKDTSSDSKSYNRKESFNIKLNSKSHLDFDVYHVRTNTETLENVGLLDVFSSQNFYDMVDYTHHYLDRDLDLSKCVYSRGFVYRTRGGATARPWENERKSIFYRKGTVIDERTKKIENPKIKLDKQSVSGVAYGEPARFNIYLTNESEQPEAATGALAFYTLYMSEPKNPNGAKLIVDGLPLTGAGRGLLLEPGKITHKTMEVYAGEDFDYEGLTIGVMSQEDFQNVNDEVSFDVHYLHTAGNVTISSPSDKWVMNTDAEYNEKRGYFLPVVISGFNKHQKNFDHIEFQYKETARGDDYWTNLCSYYADSTLMAKANGVKEMIPENGNITTQFYGEGVIMEKAYDLRAVLFCRNGSNFLTTSSKVLSGVKDTRRPQLFGTPEPSNGILGASDNIVFNFSEDIEYNYLSAITNFEVKGEVNNDEVTNEVSLQFSGKGGTQTEAERNFADKNITIDMLIRPDSTGKAMPLFSHGSDGKRLQLWITEERKLKAIIDSSTYESTDTIERGFTQVAMVISQPTDSQDKCMLEFYNGGVNIGRFEMAEPYTGTGPIILGSTNEANPKRRSFYTGRMMEVRLWYRALDGGLIGTTYGNKRLTGYEMGLMDYWPMNDGSGNFIIDKAQGANMQINSGVAWAVPSGMSLHLDFEDKGLALKQSAISRTNEQDYTLMFWFKTGTTGRGALICNGSGMAEDEGSENQFFIGFESQKLRYRTNGKQIEIPGYWCDDDWHHYAMTVNRGMNVVNIYVDQVLRASFEPDSLGGISGGHPMLGNCFYDRKQDGVVKTFDSANYLQGNLDEILLFDQALPLSLIKSFGTRSPHGDEAGLVTYLSFDRQERTKDNDIVLKPYEYSKKIYVDRKNNNQIVYEKDPVTQEPTNIPQRDYCFVDTASVILSHINQTMGAPIIPDKELHNLNFSFVGRDHSLLVNINNSDEKINKRNIYVTVQEIPDKNGNNMASAATASFFVDRNPLRWKQKSVVEEQMSGQSTVFNVLIQNNSQETHIYTITNYPKWLTISPKTNTIGPTDEQTIQFTVNKDLNVGKYDEIIYLTDENGLAEPLALSLSVKGEEPEWTWGVDRALRQHSMNITAQVMLNNEIDTEPEDIVGVFDNEGVCHGVANISYDEETGESFAFITVYDSLTTAYPLNFKLWNHSIGREQTLTPRDENDQHNLNITFEQSKVVGTPSKPIILKGGDLYIQTIELEKGWNWVSFNVLNDSLRNYSSLLDKFQLHEGDIMTDFMSGAVLVYTNGHWLTSNNEADTRFNHKYAYFIKVKEDVTFEVTGTLVKQKEDRTIRLKPGWNSVAYTPMLNLTVETALTDYNPKGTDGDVIKSHDEYAIFTVSNGVGRWKGNLKYMKPGEGYMLLRNDSTNTEFTYPYYDPGTTFLDEVSAAPARRINPDKKNSMSVTAEVKGITLQAGDRLKAFSGGELVGETLQDEEGIFYLSVAGDDDSAVWFAVERDDDIVASTPEIMRFKANAVIGKPDEPTIINFTHSDMEMEGWYTISGIKLNGKPDRKGVYIYNGKKFVIE